MEKAKKTKELRILLHEQIEVAREFDRKFVQGWTPILKLIVELGLQERIEFRSVTYDEQMLFVKSLVDSATEELILTLLDIELDISGRV